MRRKVLTTTFSTRELRYLVFLLAGILLLALVVSTQDARAKEGESYIGVIMQALTDNVIKGLGLSVAYGVLISEVVDDSPAEEAGLEEGDVIIEFDGKKVRKPKDLKRLVLKTNAGEKVNIKVIRDDEKKTLVLEVGEWPQKRHFSFTIPGDLPTLKRDIVSFLSPSARLGVRVAELNHELASYFKVHAEDGVLVIAVEEGSAADDAGIKSGDVILELGGEEIDSVDGLHEAVKDMDWDEEFAILVVRHGKEKQLTGRLDEEESSYWYFEGYGKRKPEKLLKGRLAFEDDRKELRKEMKELREELEELKRELKKLQRK